jgi:drug/metabolite transporter (DMT)-like permease
VAALLAITLLIPAGHVDWSASAWDLVLMLAVGALAAVGYLAIYAALTAGPMAVVSPIVSAYSAIVIALSLIVLGEHLSGVALLGASVVIVGVTLASANLRVADRPRVLRGPGVKLALVAMVTFGVATFGLGRFAQDFGWLLPAFLARVGTLAVVAVAFARVGRRRKPDPPGRWLPMAVGAGVLDVGATVSFVLGSRAGLISLVAAAAATYPLVPVVAGMRVFHERITPVQLVGVVTVLTGLVILAFR